jgi:Astacin (Peptidase family M12A)
MISDAIEQFKTHTCIKFTPRGGEKDYVVFDNTQTGCWSPVGKTGGAQTINLQTPGCITRVGTVMHEILHTTGFFHEQNRFDRDDFVKVNFNNIEEDKNSNFEKISSEEISTFGVDYDIDSVLHYSPYAFSKNTLMTIQSLYNPKLNDRMGQRDGFSKGDIKKINKMYCV